MGVILLEQVSDLLYDLDWQTSVAELKYEADQYNVIVDITSSDIALYIPYLNYPSLIVVGSVDEALAFLRHLFANDAIATE